MRITNKKDYEKAKEELSKELDNKPCEYYVQLEKAIEEYESEYFFDQYGSFKPDTEERIICSAVCMDGDVICSYRHGDAFNILLRLYKKEEITNPICGFLTNHNRFVDRKEGWEIANKMNQFIISQTFETDKEFGDLFTDGYNPSTENILTSEDLW